MNGAGWGHGFPRLMSNAQLAATLEAAQNVGKGRFVCVGDISCDIEVRAPSHIYTWVHHSQTLLSRVALNSYHNHRHSPNLSSVLVPRTSQHTYLQ